MDEALNCTGNCCAVFPLPKNVIERLENGANGEDGPFILDMLVPLTRRQAVRRALRLGLHVPPKVGRTHDLYTCRHWDEDTRLCTVYDERPKMCRAYPYGRECDHCGDCAGEPYKESA